jgi:hypothetical protein
MAKRIQTVAALGFMKTLLLLFNTAFWVRPIEDFLMCQPIDI